jgi:hypothetical protein
MAIKFSCPHCKKGLKVADNLAGKKAACPGCKKLIQIPAQTVYIPSSAVPGGGSGVTDIEAMAAAALAEQKQEVVVAKEIPLTCPYCDENVKFPADLGGKQAPCPACKRLVKVPMPAKTGPRDWRKPEEQRLPSGAKRDDATPDGSWGTEAVRGVSRAALVEADVIQEEKIPISPRQWIVGGVLATILIGGGIWGTYWWLGRTKTKLGEHALELAQKTLADPKADAATKAELERVLGIYHETAKKDPADQSAKQRLMKARQAVERIGDPQELVPVIRELIQTQLELGAGNDEMAAVLALAPAGDSRELVVRQLCRKALAPGGNAELRTAQVRMAITQGIVPVMRQRPAGAGSAVPGGVGAQTDASEQTACLAILGQEWVSAGKTEAAQQLAAEIRQRHKPDDPFPHQLNVLMIMLGKPEIEGKQDPESAVLAARAEGNARTGNVAKAIDTIINLPQFAPPTVQRLNTILAVADALIQRDQKPRALELLKRDCEALLDRFRDETAWQRQQLIELCLAAGDAVEAERLAGVLLAGNALDRARLSILRAKLANQAADPSLVSGFSQKSSAYHVALFEVARARATGDVGDAMKWAESLETDAAKGFAALGAASGMKQAK